MKKIKVLNGYAGLGGNRKDWNDDEVEVTAVELNPEIAAVYQSLYPNDTVIVGDAHDYLLKHHREFDFIWMSPECPTHSQFRQRCGVKAWGQEEKYPDMKLYEEIIFLQYHAKCPYVVENVISYYDPLVKPQNVSRHYFWASFIIPNKRGLQTLNIKGSEVKDLQKLHGIDLTEFKIKDKRKLLRNCVEPALGLHVFNAAFKKKQQTLQT